MKKIILITGASRGIGKATAIELASQDYFVFINYKENHQAAKELVQHIISAGGHAVCFQANISLEAEVEKLFNNIDQLDGRLYGLVNNAGILPPQAELIAMSAERIQQTLTTNILGTLLCSKEAVKRMRKYGGSIVNISSGASKSGSAFDYIDYAASKGAIDTFTIGLSKEVAKYNIRVNAIRPGFINTEMHTIPNRLKSVVDMIPMNRIGQPEEIAKAISWLISEDASYSTGSIIDVSGGK